MKKGREPGKMEFSHTNKRPGFESVAEGIAEQRGVSMNRARRMLAAGTQRTSKKAKRRNPPNKHPGFESVAEGIAEQRGVSMNRARRMLAAGTRRSSRKAKRRNPRLKRVKG